jgi:hypothetical protein
VERGECIGNVKELEKRIAEQIRLAPHKQIGQPVAAEMQKEPMYLYHNKQKGCNEHLYAFPNGQERL